MIPDPRPSWRTRDRIAGGTGPVRCVPGVAPARRRTYRTRRAALLVEPSTQTAQDRAKLRDKPPAQASSSSGTPRAMALHPRGPRGRPHHRWGTWWVAAVLLAACAAWVAGPCAVRAGAPAADGDAPPPSLLPLLPPAGDADPPPGPRRGLNLEAPTTARIWPSFTPGETLPPRDAGRGSPAPPRRGPPREHPAPVRGPGGRPATPTDLPSGALGVPGPRSAYTSRPPTAPALAQCRGPRGRSARGSYRSGRT